MGLALAAWIAAEVYKDRSSLGNRFANESRRLFRRPRRGRRTQGRVTSAASARQRMLRAAITSPAWRHEIHAKSLGLDRRVKFELRDYRELEGKFDRVVSVGMFEHVGTPQYAEFFGVLRELLADKGI